jgi:DNA-binding transcriptional ArsR family regulator
MEHYQKIAQISKVLGVDTRVKIIRLLADKSLCVGALSHRLGITPAAVSQHLRILKSVGLVVPEKKGYFVHYSLDHKVLEDWRSKINNLLDIQGEF